MYLDITLPNNQQCLLPNLLQQLTTEGDLINKTASKNNHIQLLHHSSTISINKSALNNHSSTHQTNIQRCNQLLTQLPSSNLSVWLQIDAFVQQILNAIDQNDEGESKNEGNNSPNNSQQKIIKGVANQLNNQNVQSSNSSNNALPKPQSIKQNSPTLNSKVSQTQTDTQNLRILLRLKKVINQLGYNLSITIKPFQRFFQQERKGQLKNNETVQSELHTQPLSLLNCSIVLQIVPQAIILSHQLHGLCVKILPTVTQSLMSQLYIPSHVLVEELLSSEAVLAIRNTNEQSKQLTAEIIHSLGNLEGFCAYLSFLKKSSLSSMGQLLVQYPIWERINGLTVKMLACNGIQTLKYLQLDQSLTNQWQSEEFQRFIERTLQAIQQDDAQQTTQNSYNYAHQVMALLASTNHYIKQSPNAANLHTFLSVLLSEVMSRQLMAPNTNVTKYDPVNLIVQGLKLLPEAQLPHLLTKAQKLVSQLIISPNNISCPIVYAGIGQLIQFLITHQHEEFISQGLLSQIRKNIQLNPRNSYQITALCISKWLYTVSQEPSRINNLQSNKQLSQTLLKLLCQYWTYHRTLFSVYCYTIVHHSVASSELSQQDTFYQIVAALHLCHSGVQHKDLSVFYSDPQPLESDKSIPTTKDIDAKTGRVANCIILFQKELNNNHQCELKRATEFNQSNIDAQSSFIALKANKDTLISHSLLQACLINNELDMLQMLKFLNPFLHSGVPLPLSLALSLKQPPEGQEDVLAEALLDDMAIEEPLKMLKFCYEQLNPKSIVNTQNKEEDLTWVKSKSDQKLIALCMNYQRKHTQKREFARGCANWIQYQKNNSSQSKSKQNISIPSVFPLEQTTRKLNAINMFLTVFDKLTDESQKSLKQLVNIYEWIVTQLTPIIHRLRPILVNQIAWPSTVPLKKTKEDEQPKSMINQHLISMTLYSTSYLVSKVGSMISLDNQMVLNALFSAVNLESTPLSPTQQINQIIYGVESAFLTTLIGFQSDLQAKHKSSLTWISETTQNLQIALKMPTSQLIAQLTHLKPILSSVLIPEMILQCQPGNFELIFSLIFSSIKLIVKVDECFEEHFAALMDAIEKLKQKNKLQIDRHTLLLTHSLKLMFKCTLLNIRVRSFYIFKLIVSLKQLHGQQSSYGPKCANVVILRLLKLLSEQNLQMGWIPTSEMQRLSAAPSPNSYNDLLPGELSFCKMAASQVGCLFSMLLNVLCRINYKTLSQGILKLYTKVEDKRIYLSYLNQLTLKLSNTQPNSINIRERQILKVDVYGNIELLFQAKTSLVFLPDILALTIESLRLTDHPSLSSARSLPLKLLTHLYLTHQPTNQLPVQLYCYPQCVEVCLLAGLIACSNEIQTSAEIHCSNVRYLTSNEKGYDRLLTMNELLTFVKNNSIIKTKPTKGNNKKATKQTKNIPALNWNQATNQIQSNQYPKRLLNPSPNSTTHLSYLTNLFHSAYLSYINQPSQQNAKSVYAPFKCLMRLCISHPWVVEVLEAQDNLTVHTKSEKDTNLNSSEFKSFRQIINHSVSHCLWLWSDYYYTIVSCNNGFVANLQIGSIGHKNNTHGQNDKNYGLPLSLVRQIAMRSHLLQLLRQLWVKDALYYSSTVTVNKTLPPNKNLKQLQTLSHTLLLLSLTFSHTSTFRLHSVYKSSSSTVNSDNLRLCNLVQSYYLQQVLAVINGISQQGDKKTHILNSNSTKIILNHPTSTQINPIHSPLFSLLQLCLRNSLSHTVIDYSKLIVDAQLRDVIGMESQQSHQLITMHCMTVKEVQGWGRKLTEQTVQRNTLISKIIGEQYKNISALNSTNNTGNMPPQTNESSLIYLPLSYISECLNIYNPPSAPTNAFILQTPILTVYKQMKDWAGVIGEEFELHLGGMGQMERGGDSNRRTNVIPIGNYVDSYRPTENSNGDGIVENQQEENTSNQLIDGFVEEDDSDDEEKQTNNDGMRDGVVQDDIVQDDDQPGDGIKEDDDDQDGDGIVQDDEDDHSIIEQPETNNRRNSQLSSAVMIAQERSDNNIPQQRQQQQNSSAFRQNVPSTTGAHPSLMSIDNIRQPSVATGFSSLLLPANKQTIQPLIEDYALNPQVLFQIVAQLPQVPLGDLYALQQWTQQGDLRDAIRYQLRRRKVPAKSNYHPNISPISSGDLCSIGCFYVDQSQLYSRLAQDQSIVNKMSSQIAMIPVLPRSLLRAMLALQHQELMAKLCLRQDNLWIVMEEIVSIARLSNEQSLRSNVLNGALKTLVEKRLGLVLLFFGRVQRDTSNIIKTAASQLSSSNNGNTQSILDVIFMSLLTVTPSVKDDLVQALSNYEDTIHALPQKQLSYPYYSLDGIKLSTNLAHAMWARLMKGQNPGKTNNNAQNRQNPPNSPALQTNASLTAQSSQHGVDPTQNPPAEGTSNINSTNQSPQQSSVSAAANQTYLIRLFQLMISMDSLVLEEFCRHMFAHMATLIHKIVDIEQPIIKALRRKHPNVKSGKTEIEKEQQQIQKEKAKKARRQQIIHQMSQQEPSTSVNNAQSIPQQESSPQYNYSGTIIRLIQSYWSSRVAHNADRLTPELEECRNLLVQVSTQIIPKFKEHLFKANFLHQQFEKRKALMKVKATNEQKKEENIRSKHNQASLRQVATSGCQIPGGKLGSFRNNKDTDDEPSATDLGESQIEEWRKYQLNLIVRQELSPIIDSLAATFITVLQKYDENVLSQIHSLLGNQFPQAPIIYKQATLIYHLQLSYQLMVREQQNQIHSMSLLKTKPSIESTQDTVTGRRRSSLLQKRGSHKLSIMEKHVDANTVRSLLKKTALVFPFMGDTLAADSPLLPLHAKPSSIESKLRLLRTPNTKGEKKIEISRLSVWQDTLQYLDESFPHSSLKISIKGEIGLDYGGVSKEWVTLVARQVANPQAGLFELSANGLAVQPSRNSWIVPNHLLHFNKFGMLVGKALKQNWLLELNFTRSFLKHILGYTLYVEDLEDIDPDTSRSLLWILENQVNEDLCLNFTYEVTSLAGKQTVPLIPDGENIFVTEDNKKDYVKKLAYTKMTSQIRQQSKAFISGLEQVVSFSVLKMFSYKQIGMYLSGMPVINGNKMDWCEERFINAELLFMDDFTLYLFISQFLFPISFLTLFSLLNATVLQIPQLHAKLSIYNLVLVSAIPMDLS